MNRIVKNMLHPWLNLHCPCLCFSESGTVSIMGGNLTVVQDQHVEFQCITAAWFPAPTISWTRNGQLVNSSLYSTTNVTEGDYYNSTSVLQFPAVIDTTVECLATVQTLRSPQTSSVFLVVGKKIYKNFLLFLYIIVSSSVLFKHSRENTSSFVLASCSFNAQCKYRMWKCHPFTGLPVEWYYTVPPGTQHTCSRNYTATNLNLCCKSTSDLMNMMTSNSYHAEHSKKAVGSRLYPTALHPCYKDK